MRFVDNWLKGRSVFMLMTIHGMSMGTAVAIYVIFILTSTNWSLVGAIPIFLIWRCRKEAERRDKLIISWADRDIYVVTVKDKGM